MCKSIERHTILVAVGVLGILSLLMAIGMTTVFALAPLGDTLNYTITSSSDDATQSVVGGVVDTSAGVVALGDIGGLSSTVVGLRFTNIEVPQGALVTNARVTLTSSGAWSGSTTLFINGHDVGNSGTFSASNGPLDRVGQLTSNGAATTPGDWNNGAAYQTPDLSAILNEIFARPDWAYGNSLSIIIQDDGVVNDVRREAVSFDGNSGQAAELSFEYTQEPDDPVGPGVQILPDWVITDFNLTRHNDCEENVPEECGISFEYEVGDNNGNSSFLADVESNHVHIIDLNGQEFAVGPHPGGTGFIPYSEFPSLAYADLMACGASGLIAVVEGGVYGEVNTSNNAAVYNLPNTDDATDVRFPDEPLRSWFRPSQHDAFSLLLPLQYFIEGPSTVDTPCLPLAMLGDYDVQMTVYIEGLQDDQYVEPPGDVFWHLFGWGTHTRPQSGDDVLIELLLNSDNGIEEGDYTNNTCLIHMRFHRRTPNPFDVITYDYMTLESTDGCEVIFGLQEFIIGPSSTDEALTGLGMGEDEAAPGIQTIGIIVIIVAAAGGGWAGSRFAPDKWGALLPTAAGAVVAAGVAAGAVALVASMGSEDIAPESSGGDSAAAVPDVPENIEGLVRLPDDQPRYCDAFAYTYAEAIYTEAGEVEDVLIHMMVVSSVTLPDGSRFLLTVLDDEGAGRTIATDETSVSLASAGLYPDSVSFPVMWQVRIEYPAGSGGDLYLPLCFPDGWHGFDGDSAMPPRPTVRPPVGVPPPAGQPGDSAAPTVTNISVKPTMVYIKTGTVTVSAIVTDPSGIQSVTVFYRISGGKWFSKSMSLAGGRYTAVLGPFDTAGNWEFHIRAVDNVGNANCAAGNPGSCPGGSFLVNIPK